MVVLHHVRASDRVTCARRFQVLGQGLPPVLIATMHGVINLVSGAVSHKAELVLVVHVSRQDLEPGIRA